MAGSLHANEVVVMPDTELLFENLMLGDARGGRKPAKQVMIEVERELVPEDIEALRRGDSPASPQRIPTILNIKHAHHTLARLIACDDAKLAEISLQTGYSPAYISTLKSDPAFKELLAYYTEQKNIKFVDTLERMKTFGLTVLDELQRRFEDNPEDFKKSELLNMTDLFLLRGNPSVSGNGGGGGGAGKPAVQVSVSFITPPPLEGPMAMKSIEGEINR